MFFLKLERERFLYVFHCFPLFAMFVRPMLIKNPCPQYIYKIFNHLFIEFNAKQKTLNNQEKKKKKLERKTKKISKTNLNPNRIIFLIHYRPLRKHYNITQ